MSMRLMTYKLRVWVLKLVLLGTLLAQGSEFALAQASPETKTPSTDGAKVAVVDLPVPLLPDRFAEWTQATLNEVPAGGSSQRFEASTCAPDLSGTPLQAPSDPRCTKVLEEDGLTRTAVARYKRAGGSAELKVFAEQFGDSTGAYGGYTFYRSLATAARITPGGQLAETGKHLAGETSTDAAGTLVWAGTVLLRVEGPISHTDLAALEAALPKVGGRKGLAPLLPTYLPSDGLNAVSARYALGPVSYQTMRGVLPAAMLNWDKSAEAITANYTKRNSKGELTLLLYPTPEIAGERGRAIEKAVHEAGGAAVFGTVKMRRIGPLIGMTSGAALSAEEAQALIGALHLTGEVTFDQKMPLEFHTEVKKTASLLQNIAVLCGVLILAALLLGLFLGGARAGIRVLQGKSAASEPEFLTINLRDSQHSLFSSVAPDNDGSPK